jgi:signal transduction histidine kinase/DNA-binding response OmpR family regulator
LKGLGRPFGCTDDESYVYFPEFFSYINGAAPAPGLSIADSMTLKSIFLLSAKEIQRFTADPRLSQIELMRKQVAFNWTIGSFVSVILLTGLAYFLGARIIGHFGLVLIVMYAIDLPLFRKHNYDFYQAIFLALVILTAFIFMLIFGGYTHSAGLVFVGLTCVISSTLMRSLKAAFALFILYVATILGLAVMKPYLRPHPDITPEINFTFFIVNTIWMSAVMMFFVIEYLTQRNKYQLAETRRLQELDKAKSDLFASISHEFRTPLTLINGMANQIIDTGSSASGSAHQIVKQSKKLLHLVNQILDLGRIDSNTLQSHFIQSDVIRYLKYLSEPFHSAADSKGLAFQVKMAIDELEMDFDPEKLEGIVVNLIFNAIKFTDSGGSIMLAVDKSRDGFLEISVRDSGIGIEEREHQRIFDRFYQANPGHYQEGNGLGLTIVREYAQLAKGRVEVESEPGKGSTFKVRLPITRVAPSQDPVMDENRMSESPVPATVPAPSGGIKPLLLIIDDHQEITDYLSILLRDQYDIIRADTGKKGYDLVLLKVPDIIISDVMMPEMDGFDFLKKLKSDFRISHIPVLLLTARADRSSVLQGLELGAEAYLIKPFDRQELFIRLRKLLDLRKILQDRYRRFEPGTSEPDPRFQLEDQFMQKVHRVIEENLDNESFDIHALCREVGVSRAQLYRKFHALTNLTIHKYIRSLRLAKARQLFHNSGLSVSEIAFRVGFKSLSSFSTAFTGEFGINPSKVDR